MSALLIESECKQSTDWLTRLVHNVRYKPAVVGSNYQPLGTKWSSQPILDDIADRKRNQMVSVKGPMHSSFLFFGGWSSRTQSRYNDVHEIIEGSSRARLKRRRCEWSPRSDLHAHASRDGKTLFIIGGDDGRARSDTWVSLDGGNSFRERTEEAPWGGRTHFASCLIDNSTIVVCGGVSAQAEYLSDLWISKDQGVTWSRLCDRCPWGSRQGVCLVTLEDGSLLLAGGASESKAYDDVWRSTDEGLTWSCLTRRAPWKPRQGLSMVQDPLSLELVMFGGTDYTGQHSLNDSWASVDGGITWVPRPRLPSDTAPHVVPIVSDKGTLSIFTMGSIDGPTRSYTSKSDLKFIQRDCLFLLMLGSRIEASLPKEIWVGKVLPMVIDIRSLWERRSSEWKKL